MCSGSSDVFFFWLCCRIWTCFEHVMKLTPDLMRDRHMDQLIMCSVYVLSKASPRALVCRCVTRAHLTFSGSGYWAVATGCKPLRIYICIPSWVCTRCVYHCSKKVIHHTPLACTRHIVWYPDLNVRNDDRVQYNIKGLGTRSREVVPVPLNVGAPIRFQGFY